MMKTEFRRARASDEMLTGMDQRRTRSLAKHERINHCHAADLLHLSTYVQSCALHQPPHFRPVHVHDNSASPKMTRMTAAICIPPAPTWTAWKTIIERMATSAVSHGT